LTEKDVKNNGIGHSGYSSANLLRQELELERLQQQYEDDTEQLKQSYLREMADAKTASEVHLRNRELALGDKSEKQLLQLQKQCDFTAAKRDEEIGVLLRTLGELQQVGVICQYAHMSLS
jgi:cell division septum initiation protein DivIVA